MVFSKNGRGSDVPIRIRRRVVQVQVERAYMRPIVRVAAVIREMNV